MRRSVLFGGRLNGRRTMLAAVAQHLAAQAVPMPAPVQPVGLVLRGADVLPAGMSHLSSAMGHPRLFLSVDPASGDDLSAVSVWSGL